MFNKLASIKNASKVQKIIFTVWLIFIALTVPFLPSSGEDTQNFILGFLLIISAISWALYKIW
ncbi:MAG: hypothetical protein AAB838_02695 [Patescibacteria group bacterium]